MWNTLRIFLWFQLQCSKCYVVFYCGPTCQRSDWGIHRVICASYNKIVSLKIPPKPSKGKSLLVYFFPEDKKAAKLAWVEHFNFPFYIFNYLDMLPYYLCFMQTWANIFSDNHYLRNIWYLTIFVSRLDGIILVSSSRGVIYF